MNSDWITQVMSFHNNQAVINKLTPISKWMPVLYVWFWTVVLGRGHHKGKIPSAVYKAVIKNVVNMYEWNESSGVFSHLEKSQHKIWLHKQQRNSPSQPTYALPWEWHICVQCQPACACNTQVGTAFVNCQQYHKSKTIFLQWVYVLLNTKL